MKKLCLLLLVIGLVGLQALSALAAPELKKFKVGYLPTSGHLLYFIAKEKAYFQKEGLDVELFRFTNSGEGLTAIKTGKLDAGSFGTSAPLVFISKGADFTLFGGQMGEGHGLVAKPDNAVRFKDLKNYRGATIGAIRLATGDVVFRAALKKAGIDWKKDITIKEFDSPPAVLEAIKKGSVDAGLLWIPYLTIAENQGLKVVKYSGDVIKSHTCCRQVALTSSIREREADYVRFMTALLRAYKFYAEDRQGTVDAVSKYVTIDKKSLEKDIYDGHLLISPDPHQKSIVQFWDFMKEVDYITSNESIGKRINTRIYQTALNNIIKKEPKDKIYRNLLKEFNTEDADLHIKKH